MNFGGNFTKKLSKCEDFNILYENIDEEYLIVSTTITFVTNKEYNSNPFQPYNHKRNTNIPIFFILATNDQFSKFKEFRKKEIPILILPSVILKSKLDILLKELNKFIEFKFKTLE